MKYLLDANVLFGALTEAHPHHRVFRRWVKAHLDDGLGTCAEVRLAYLRLSLNPTVMNQCPLNARQAWDTLEQFVRDAAPETVSSSLPKRSFLAQAKHHRDVQDFYLVQLASEVGARLATQDSRLCGKWPQHTVKVG